jgi:hypothetical protein
MLIGVKKKNINKHLWILSMKCKMIKCLNDMTKLLISTLGSWASLPTINLIPSSIPIYLPKSLP